MITCRFHFFCVEPTSSPSLLFGPRITSSTITTRACSTSSTTSINRTIGTAGATSTTSGTARFFITMEHGWVQPRSSRSPVLIPEVAPCSFPTVDSYSRSHPRSHSHPHSHLTLIPTFISASPHSHSH
jgi:hypothetical protein